MCGCESGESMTDSLSVLIRIFLMLIGTVTVANPEYEVDHSFHVFIQFHSLVLLVKGIPVAHEECKSKGIKVSCKSCRTA